MSQSKLGYHCTEHQLAEFSYFNFSKLCACYLPISKIAKCTSKNALPTGCGLIS